MQQLDWLPEHRDFPAALRAARAAPDPLQCLQAAISLAGYRRDFTATRKIDRLAQEALAATDACAAGLVPLRVAILATHTVDHLVPSIRVAGLNRRMHLDVFVAPYGLYRQVLLANDPALTEFHPQCVVFALDARDAPLQLPLTAADAEVEFAVAARVEELRALWRIARERYGAQVVQQTLVAADPAVFGQYESFVPASPIAVTDRLNAALRRAAATDGVLLLDLAWYVAQHGGMQGINDAVRWHQAKQLISPASAPVYGDLVARVLGAVVGLSRKCLVLDLDNTLWGGVIGDDGIEGIALGQGNPLGEAFLAFQRYIALLSQRGIILAVCSKNDAAVAEAAFTGHPDMALRRDQIAAFVANWDDKATNLRSIARTLNIGLDSLVFVDDNPAEREVVRRELPEVAVPELPDDVAEYPMRVAAGGYFEAKSFTADDAARTKSYALNAERAALLEHATDMDSYLRSLDMVATAVPVGAAELPRAVQLINKTNQFNLTTRRTTDAEMQGLVERPDTIALAFRLADRFGDNGVISIVVARPDPAWKPHELLIDTWLMSCRVLGRGMEAAALEVLARKAGQFGASVLVGEYRPTSRNGMVAGHYAALGFEPCPAPPGSAAGATFWRLEIGTTALPNHSIAIQESS